MKVVLRVSAALIAAVALLAIWVVQPTLTVVPAGRGEGVDPIRLREHVERIAVGIPHRHFFRPETLERTARYIENAFVRAGARVDSQFYDVEGMRYRNVTARFGPEEGRPLIVGAHYDAEEHAAGADDNASGIAGLLELAVALGRNPPRQPVELVAYTLEEPPYFGTEQMGSRRHAASVAASGKLPRLVLVLEMIGYFDDRPGSQSYPLPGMAWLYPRQGDFVALVGNLGSPRLVRSIKMTMEAATALPVRSINAPAWIPGVDFSDHSSYWDFDMPAVMVTDTAFYRNPNYHHPGDLPDTLDYRRMALVVEAVLATIRKFDQENDS